MILTPPACRPSAVYFDKLPFIVVWIPLLVFAISASITYELEVLSPLTLRNFITPCTASLNPVNGASSDSYAFTLKEISTYNILAK